MAAKHVINVDLANVYGSLNAAGSVNKRDYLRTMSWGDQVEVLEVKQAHVEVRVFRFERQADGTSKPVPAVGYIAPPKSGGIKPAAVVA